MKTIFDRINRIDWIRKTNFTHLSLVLIQSILLIRSKMVLDWDVIKTPSHLLALVRRGRNREEAEFMCSRVNVPRAFVNNQTEVFV